MRSVNWLATETPAKARIGVVMERKSTAKMALTAKSLIRQTIIETMDTQPRIGKSWRKPILVLRVKSEIMMPSRLNSQRKNRPTKVMPVMGAASG